MVKYPYDETNETLQPSADGSDNVTPITAKIRRLPNPRTATSLLKATTPRIHDVATTAVDEASKKLNLDTPTDSSSAPIEVVSELTQIEQTAYSVDETYADLERQARARRLALIDSDSLPDLSPGEVLMLDIRRTHVLVNEMARRISPIMETLPDPSALDRSDPDFIENQRQTYNAFLGMTVKGSKPHAFLSLMLNFQKHLTQVAKSALDADIADRMTSVAETDALEMLEVMRNVLNDDELNLTVEQRKVLPKLLRRHIEEFRAKRARKRHSSVAL